jgi:uncharacterized protein (DUF849 family)
MLQACLNGDRRKSFNIAVPCTPDELARDARAVVDAGADELHVHPRDARGLETLEPAPVAAALNAMRNSAPGVPIGLSTRWAIRPSGRARQRSIAAWSVLPDHVSVNLIEDDAPEVISLALGKGIGIEAGIWSTQDARRFAALDHASSCLRVLIEINEQDEREGRAVAMAICGILDGASLTMPRLLHGCDKTKWPLFRQAVSLGLDARIGFEDGASLPNGETAKDNASLIQAARRILQSGHARDG